MTVRTTETGGRPHFAVIGTRGYPSYYGGFETLNRQLVPHALDAGWDVTVYGRPGSTRPEDPSRRAEARSVETAGVESRSLSTLSFGLSAVLHALVHKPDAALVMNVANGFWLPLLRARGIPTVMNVDGIEWERGKWGPAARVVFQAGAWLSARFAGTLVYDAEAIRQRWLDRFGRDGLVIPYGAHPPGPLPVPAGLEHRGYVLMVARFVPENSVSAFFDAAAAISRRAPVVIVGSSGYGGPFDERAAALAEAHPGIQWRGHISDDQELFALWQHAGVYFHGHSVGGTNPALVQAMACGAPVVARDTVYNREVLGTAGRFAEPTSAEILDAVTELLLDPSEQERLSEAVRRRAARAYTWDAVCDAYLDALAGRPPAEGTVVDLSETREPERRTT